MRKNIYLSLAMVISASSSLANSPTECQSYYGIKSKTESVAPKPTTFAELKMRTVEPIGPLNREILELLKLKGTGITQKDKNAFENSPEVPYLIFTALDLYPDKASAGYLKLKGIADKVRKGKHPHYRYSNEEFIKAFVSEVGSLRETAKILANYRELYGQHYNYVNDYYLNKNVDEARSLGLISDAEFIAFIKALPAKKSENAMILNEDAASIIRSKIVYAHLIGKLMAHNKLTEAEANAEVANIREHGEMSVKIFETVFNNRPLFKGRYGYLTGKDMGSDASLFTMFDLLHLKEFRTFLLLKSNFTEENVYNLTLMFKEKTKVEAMYRLFSVGEFADTNAFPQIANVIRHIVETVYKDGGPGKQSFFSQEYRENSWDGGQLRSESSSFSNVLSGFISFGEYMAVKQDKQSEFVSGWEKAFSKSTEVAKRFLNYSLGADPYVYASRPDFFPFTINRAGEFSASSYTNKTLSFLARNLEKTNQEIATVYDRFRDLGSSDSLNLRLVEMAVILNKTPDVVYGDFKVAVKLVSDNTLQIAPLDLLALSYQSGVALKKTAEQYKQKFPEALKLSYWKVAGELTEISILSGKTPSELNTWMNSIAKRIDQVSNRYNTIWAALEILQSAVIASKNKKTSLRSEIINAEKFFLDVTNIKSYLGFSGRNVVDMFRYHYFLGVEPKALFPKKKDNDYSPTGRVDFADGKMDFTNGKIGYYVLSGSSAMDTR